MLKCAKKYLESFKMCSTCVCAYVFKFNFVSDSHVNYQQKIKFKNTCVEHSDSTQNIVIHSSIDTRATKAIAFMVPAHRQQLWHPGV